MNKADLVNSIADKAGVTKKQADSVLTAALDIIIDTVSDGDKVTLVGFGSFEPRHRKARNGRNPQTGKALKIPATTVPAFSAGKFFKEQVADQVTERTVILSENFDVFALFNLKLGVEQLSPKPLFRDGLGNKKEPN